MNSLGDTQAYDAFGEPLPLRRPRRGIDVGAGARLASIAVFWAIALLLVAGRVHYAPRSASAAIELAAR